MKVKYVVLEKYIFRLFPLKSCYKHIEQEREALLVERIDFWHIFYSFEVIYSSN